MYEDRMVFEETGDEKKEILTNISSKINKGGEPPTLDQEKRIRREIANSNERRRMQSINNGFQSLRSLLPHHEGEKLSKAAILQQTAEYIYSLEQEKTRLLSQNCQLKRLVNQHEGGELPPKKRKTEIIIPTEAVDERLSSMSPEPVSLIQVKLKPSENSAELKRQLERERNLRLILEDQVRQLESQLFQQQQQQQQQQTPLFEVEEGEAMGIQLITTDALPTVGHTQTIVCSPTTSRSCSPVNVLPSEQRIPSVLEAAIKAEPKVEVERLPTPNTSPHHQHHHHHEDTSRIFSNTSRQNLETIVEAIRHLEGDHMFGDEPQAQEVPLALTTRAKSNIVKAEMTYMDFNSSVQQQQQSRPGVIVVKQAS